jgi:hypothetical protein
MKNSDCCDVHPKRVSSHLTALVPHESEQVEMVQKIMKRKQHNTHPNDKEVNKCNTHTNEAFSVGDNSKDRLAIRDLQTQAWILHLIHN